MKLKILISCLLLIAISVQVSETMSKRKSEDLLIIPTCMGKRLPSNEYNQARKECKIKNDEMCAYICIAQRLKIVKNNEIVDSEQEHHVHDTYPSKAVDNIMKELRKCHNKFDKNDTSSDCIGNRGWATCNNKAIRQGCRDSE